MEITIISELWYVWFILMIVGGICNMYFAIKMKKILSLENSIEDCDTEKELEISFERINKSIILSITAGMVFSISAILLIVAAILH